MLRKFTSAAICAIGIAASLPGSWWWSMYEAPSHPNKSGALNPTGFYRARDDSFYITFGFLDVTPPGSGLYSFNVGVYKFPNTNSSAPIYTEVYVSGTPPLGRGLSIGAYDPVTDAMYLYGGLTCPSPPIECNFWGSQSSVFGPFLDDTVVLDFSPLEGPAWRVYSAAFLLQQQRTTAAVPPALGVALSVYDPDSVALVVWSCLSNLSVTGGPNIQPDLPVWSLDLHTLQWRATPVAPDSPALPVLPSGLQSIPVVAFEAGHNRLVAYFSDSRQLLLFDFTSGWWIAPTPAQLSAPLERQFMAGAVLVAPGYRWLCVHGGYDFWTTYKEVYVLDLDTMLWHQPASAQNNSPSRLRHVGIPGPDATGIVWWGGQHHNADDAQPGESFLLDWTSPSPPNSPLPTPSHFSLPLTSTAILAFGAAIFIVLFVDCLIREVRLQRARIKIYTARDDAMDESMSPSSSAVPRLLSALQALAGSATLWSLAALAVAWGTQIAADAASPVATATLVWPAAAASGLAVLSVAVASVLAIRQGSIRGNRSCALSWSTLLWIVACTCPACLAYAVDAQAAHHTVADPSAAVNYASGEGESDCNLPEWQTVEPVERLRRYAAVLSVALVDIPVVSLLVVTFFVGPSGTTASASPALHIFCMTCTLISLVADTSNAVVANRTLLALARVRGYAAELHRDNSDALDRHLL